VFAREEFKQFSGRFAGPSVELPITTFCRAQYALSEADAQGVVDLPAVADGESAAQLEEKAATTIKTRTRFIVPHRQTAG